MKIVLRNILLISLLGLFAKCDEEEEITSRGYPRLKTLPVSEISSNGAVFNAEIVFRGEFEILNFGFVWSGTENPTIEDSDRVVYSENIQSEKFSEVVETALEEETSYFVRAFVETDDFIVYGENVSFISLGSKGPVIKNITPLQGTLGDTIQIQGENFSYLSQTNKVLFDTVSSQIIESTDSTLVTLVPDFLRKTTSDISIEIVGNTNTYSESFELLSPIIESVSKEQAKTYDTLLLKGQYLGTTVSHLNVFFGEIESDIINFYKDSVEIVVPGGIEEDVLKVKVAHQSDEVVFNYLKPAIVDFEPKMITWGDTVEVTVENFYENTEFQKLFLNGTEYDFLDANEDLLSFIIPNNLIVDDGNTTTRSTTIGFEIAGFNLEFNDEASFKSPQILSISSDTVSFGDLVTLEVANFHPTSNRVILQYKGIHREEAAIVSLSKNTSNRLEFVFPFLDDLRNSEPSDNLISLNAGVSNTQLFDRDTVTISTPIIDSFSPMTLSDPGDEFTILGRNFGDNPIVKFDRTQLSVISSSENEIRVEITEDVFQDSKISEYLENTISVTSNQRSGWSTELLTINHITKWEHVNDDNLFQIPGGFLDQRTAFQTLSGDSYGYLLGGRGELIECCIIPSGLQKLRDVYRFDPSNNSWLQLSNWPQEDDQEELQEVFAFEDRVYAITDNNRLLNSGVLPLALKSSSWSDIADLGSGAGYYNFFEIDSQPYIIYSPSATNSNINSWISTLDLENGVQTDLLELPFSYTSLDNLYVYNGKLRYRSWILENEYEYDPISNIFNLIGPIDHDFKIIKDGSNYYSYTSQTMYTFDPATGNHTQIDDFPTNEFIGLRFLINGKLYFSTSKTTMVSFDTK